MGDDHKNGWWPIHFSVGLLIEVNDGTYRTVGVYRFFSLLLSPSERVTWAQFNTSSNYSLDYSLWTVWWLKCSLKYVWLLIETFCRTKHLTYNDTNPAHSRYPSLFRNCTITYICEDSYREPIRVTSTYEYSIY